MDELWYSQFGDWGNPTDAGDGLISLEDFLAVCHMNFLGERHGLEKFVGTLLGSECGVHPRADWGGISASHEGRGECQGGGDTRYREGS